MTPRDLATAGAYWSCRSDRAEPLRIVAELFEPILYDVAEPLMLDGALQHASIVLTTGEQPSDVFHGWTGGPVEIPIPIAEVEQLGERFPALSQGFYEAPALPVVRMTRKSSDAEALGVDVLNISFGPFKSHLLPKVGVVAPRVTWFARGDAERLEALLPHVLHIGRSRSQGLGAVLRWSVERVSFDASLEWQGNPTRPLPAARGPVMGIRAPHWLRANQRPCLTHDPRGARPPLG